MVEVQVNPKILYYQELKQDLYKINLINYCFFRKMDNHKDPVESMRYVAEQTFPVEMTDGRIRWIKTLPLPRGVPPVSHLPRGI